MITFLQFDFVNLLKIINSPSILQSNDPPAKHPTQTQTQTQTPTTSTVTAPLSPQIKPQPKLILPAKLPGTPAKLKLNLTSRPLTTSLDDSKPKTTRHSNDEDDDDYDYDYDIPENNKPTSSTNTNTSNQTLTRDEKQTHSGNAALPANTESSSRKSASPTIDSGISTSSLVSLNSETFLLNNLLSSLSASSSSGDHLSSSNSSTNRSSTSSNELQNKLAPKTNLADEFKEKSAHLCLLCARVQTQARTIQMNDTRQNMLELKHACEDFLLKTLKRIKQEHACFHPDLNVFNRFKTTYRHLKEFYLFYESSLLNLERVYKWNASLVQSNSEFGELLAKLPYLGNLLDDLRRTVDENCLLEYQSETSLSAKPLSRVQNHQIDKIEASNVAGGDDYAYEYDNNDRIYTHIDENAENQAWVMT